jgi:hypothetical protein
MPLTPDQQRRAALWQSLPSPGSTLALDATDRWQILWQYGVPRSIRYLGIYGAWHGEPVLGGTWHSEPVLEGAWVDAPIEALV